MEISNDGAAKLENPKAVIIENTPPEVEPLLYELTDNPPWYLTCLFAVQLVVANISFCIVNTRLIMTVICGDITFMSKIFATMCVMTGLTTVVQTSIGVRLPIFQGPSLLGLLPYMDAKDDQRWRCGQNMTALYLTTNSTDINPEDNAWDEMWRKVQGSLMIGAAVETFMGLSGLVGLIGRAVRPVSITAMFILLGAYLWIIAADTGQAHWGIAFGSCFIILTCALYLKRIQIPVPKWTKDAGWYCGRFPIFELFPILLAILVMWPVSHVVTILGGFSDDPDDPEYLARTDIYTDNIRNAPTFRVPYPGQFGALDIDVNYILLYIPCVFASTIESIADYQQYAVACHSPRPPAHAMNRGIAMEGLGAMVSAWLGGGHMTTSFSSILGIISITKVCSRIVMISAGILIAVVGIIGPVGAVLVSIPPPVMFGPVVLSLSLLVGSAFHNLTAVNLAKGRNQAILGVSIFLGLVISSYLKYTKNAIRTDSKLFNDLVIGIFKVPFMTGGIISVFLDNTLPERDSTQTAAGREKALESRQTRVYDPPFVGAWMRRRMSFYYIPFLPGPTKRGRCRDENDQGHDRNDTEAQDSLM